MKQCIGCQTVKDDTEFNWRSRAKGQRTARCKLCIKVYNKNHYDSNTEKYKAKARKWAKENAAKNYGHLIRYFSTHPCVDCGETDMEVLEFDHRDATLKTFAVCNRLADQTWLVLSKEIEKCDVRCANCHKRRTNRQFGYWRTPLKHCGDVPLL